MQTVEEAKRRAEGLYDPAFEHDNCGIGAIVNIKGVKSHATVAGALDIVEKLEHRAGKDAEGKTGDGVGILLQISHKFFKKAAAVEGITLGEEREYGIGMFFFPQNELKRRQAMKMFEIITEKEGLKFLGWRKVPTIENILGSKALAVMPYIMQCFIEKPAKCDKGLDFDRKLFIVRRLFEQSNEDTYVVSCSSRTIVYKGMFLVDQLRGFFLDLQDEDMEAAIALVHSRFSTNTNPSWMRAHPNRFIVHNGEINTIKGNADKMHAREESIATEKFKDEMHKILPVVNREGSDSAMLDNTLEFLVMSGMPLPLAVMTLIPEPWRHNTSISLEKRDFYEYYATMMEPWDGPASILFSDGDVMGAVLDRNGLRPSRYYITDDDTLILASEVGVMNVPQSKIVKKDRLCPGKMLLVDTVKGCLIDDDDLKKEYSTRQPYGEWLDTYLVELKNLKIPNKRVPEYTHEERAKLYKAFGYTYEQFRNVILPMAKNGAETVLAMGADQAIPPMSSQYPPLFDYFRQLFAQVTNPPIDAIREEIVTSTTVFLGKGGNLLQEKPENCRMLRIDNPILTDTDLMKIKNMKVQGFKIAEISTTYYKNTSLKKAIEHLYVEADKAYSDGSNIIILSDRGVDEYHVAIPSLLAVSALQQYLVRTKKRTALSLIIETAEPREVHHFATLLGFGASAINPYLAHESIKHMINHHMLDKDYYAAVDDYNDAILHGIVKIASKMGISTIQSYQGAKIFEAIGISKEVIDEYFTGVVSRVGGLTLKDIEAQIDALHNQAFDPLGLDQDIYLNSVGSQKFRSGKEEHLYNPVTIHLLQQATWTGSYDTFKKFTEKITEEEKHISLKGLIDFNYPADGGIDIDEVEPVESIVKRFKTGAMSYGSISQEAHECMAIAMNRLGGKSNSGEGGESDERLESKGTAEDRCSAIKQVASGRFGVTSKYLCSAKEIQIKMAQGAKPGEGGQLPAGKVYPWIAKCRHSTPGVALISPPPHHDIYSIEDLAQLIYDLKNSNRDARISVKLVSEAGVGTVASGVAKAGAEVILISGFDGGTGAAPKNSIYHAGLPWELGLAETHRDLIANNLRNRVVIETDGKLLTGRDVAIAALLGAEEFGFATAPLVTMGCVMMRVCNLDTCPVGVATQNPELRKRFKGKPEYVMNFMKFIAQELREYMAKLGFRTIDEMVGRCDYLKPADTEAGSRNSKLDLTKILDTSYALAPDSHFDAKAKYDFKLDETADVTVLLKKLKGSMAKGKSQTIEVDISNTDRSFGTIFGSEVTKKFGDSLADDTYVIKCNGSGGQSFGAFIPKGVTLEVAGDSNDYFGKGLSGGKLVIYPPKDCNIKEDDNIIIGNVAFYGATSGKAFVNGVAGERFCVRNSGITAVVEGVGDHGCEYMTGGRVAIIGKTGKNFAAGMSGGIAYVLDESNDLYRRLNKTVVDSEILSEKYDILELKTMLEEHLAATGSKKAKEILDDFPNYIPKFKKIVPFDYKRMLVKIAEMEEKGMSKEQAEIEAFYANTRK
jgi:glutamate synthase (ferredoxin)